MDGMSFMTIVRNVVVVALLMGGVCAAAVAQTKADRPSAFCGTVNNEAAIQTVVSKCRAGDTVAIAKDEASAIAMVCDFSSTIVDSNRYVVCVVARAVRGRRP